MTRLRLADFAGTWRVERRISDFLGRIGGRFDGAAFVSPDGGGGMAYREDGELRLGGAPVARAGRDYLWSEERGRIHVRFADGRAFHDFAPEEAAEASHFCAPDEYRVVYGFRHWPRWSAAWRVKGPRKDYGMVTLYIPDDLATGGRRGAEGGNGSKQESGR